MAHGTPVLTLLAEKDDVTREFEAAFMRPVLDRDARYRQLCQVRVLPGADHSLLFDQGRHAALETIVGWLDRLDSSERTEARQAVRAMTHRAMPDASAATSTSGW
jgi:alpha-beta hydrolase superfamily lysophospholipase